MRQRYYPTQAIAISEAKKRNLTVAICRLATTINPLTGKQENKKDYWFIIPITDLARELDPGPRKGETLTPTQLKVLRTLKDFNGLRSDQVVRLIRYKGLEYSEKEYHKDIAQITHLGYNIQVDKQHRYYCRKAEKNNG